MDDYIHKLTERFKWCGCGNPEAAVKFLRDVLAAIKDRVDTNYDPEPCKRFDDLIQIDSHPGMAYFILYHINQLGLIEHGGSIGGSWLSSDGEILLEELKCLEFEDEKAGK